MKTEGGGTVVRGLVRSLQELTAVSSLNSLRLHHALSADTVQQVRTQIARLPTDRVANRTILLRGEAEGIKPLLSAELSRLRIPAAGLATTFY